MSNKPNLIYVFADQLRFSSVGFNGDELAKTKELDEIEKQCVNMENAVSGHPVCAPYRASLFTGKYTTSTGMVINEIRINQNHRTLANVFTENGYETCYIGKWHLYANQLGHHFNTKNSYIPKGERLGFDDFFAGYNFHHKYYAPYAYYHLDSPEKIYCKGYEPDLQTDMAIRHINRLKEGDKPFALFLSLGTPHDPWTQDNVPEEYYKLFSDTDFPLPENYSSKNDKYADMWAKFNPGARKNLNEQKRVYYAMVANLSKNIGRLYDAIEKAGIGDNTIFVFTSDHGEMQGSHGRHAKNIFYDEAVRVPFLIKWGNKLTPGRNDNCLNTVDIMPTLLSMCGLPIPDSVQGIDLSKAIIDGTHIDNPCLMMGTGPTAIYGDGYEWRAVRTRRYTYATYLRDSSEYLFDNINDPYQKRNLAGNPDYAKIKANMKAAMYKKMREAGDRFRKNSYYKKHWVKDRMILPELPQ